jgi:hypothetical protein
MKCRFLIKELLHSKTVIKKNPDSGGFDVSDIYKK